MCARQDVQDTAVRRLDPNSSCGTSLSSSVARMLWHVKITNIQSCSSFPAVFPLYNNYTAEHKFVWS